MRLNHEIASLRGGDATKNVTELADAQLDALLDGKDTTCPNDLLGDVILLHRDMPVGIGLARDGHLKNRLPRWVVQKS